MWRCCWRMARRLCGRWSSDYDRSRRQRPVDTIWAYLIQAWGVQELQALFEMGIQAEMVPTATRR